MRTDRERISTRLLELNDHLAHRLLKGGALTGVTERRWREADAAITTLWRLFDAYQTVLDRAEELCAGRPGPEELEELTFLITGPSVKTPREDLPLERAGLLGDAGEHVTLAGALTRMSAAFDTATAVVAAADAAWSGLLPRLEAAEKAWQEARAHLAALVPPGAGAPPYGETPEIGRARRLERELDAARALVRGDPLSLVRDGHADTSGLDRLTGEIGALRAVLAEAVRLREGYGERRRELGGRVDEVAVAEEEAAALRARVVGRIANVSPPEVPRLSAALRERLAALDSLRERGRWAELARRAGELERSADDALRRVRAVRDSAGGLLDRRDELRGRLGAYRAKAARLGYAEDLRVSELHRRAHDLLWTAPCDLRAATAALAEYRRALGGEGAAR
ncbi:hypothetical protein D5H75_05865 [Bailinhaonella thermotolerans]|uniref:Uncharacterized protein n=1 Tax=Bailinhaonella thermotolerans TaxID=1070861 RepID=A0A3A4B328_9ACTN|nr:hypothetical protein D5H75_05865 [Bailinhaonella thermotolerans]